MTLPSPCCCSPNCLIFKDLFDQDGDVLSGSWDIISGDMTLNSATNIATIDGGSVIGPTTDSATGSGGLNLTAFFPETSTLIKVCYEDANNYWQIEITGGHTEPDTLLDAYLVEVTETVAGSTVFKGRRYVRDLGEYLSLAVCWKESSHIRVIFTSTTTATFNWPTTIANGSSFRIEPTDDLQLSGVSFVKIVGDAPGAVNAQSCCVEETCALCPSSFNDTIQIEALDGADVGEVFVVDRYLDVTSAGGGGFGSHTLGYWEYDYVAGSGASNYSASLSFCVDGNSDDEGRLFIDPPGIGSGTTDFDASDCTGPWDVVVGGVTYRVTLL